jgi:GT2 family glycosyltransferase
LNEQPHVSIVILNWNGWKDTIECLESVLKNHYASYHIIVIDNFSENDSVKKIRDWALKNEPAVEQTNFPELVFPSITKPISFFEIEIERGEKIEKIVQRKLGINPPTGSLILIKNHENSGFAAGNNLGIKIADKLFTNDYFLFLNNDTIIHHQALLLLVNHLEKNPNIGVATSAIYHYSEPNKISNVGGKLTFWARRKYYSSIKSSRKRRVTFVTGCALMVREKTFEEFSLFSEKFFFGEEDFEFSWRLKRKKVPMVCVSESRVYHKVSVSSKILYEHELRKQFLYIFSRIVDMRDYFYSPVWWFWRSIIIFSSFFWITLKYKVKLPRAIKFAVSVEKYSRIYKDSKKTTMDKIYQEVKL